MIPLVFLFVGFVGVSLRKRWFSGGGDEAPPEGGAPAIQSTLWFLNNSA